jgi:hypothetical protein
MQGHKFSALEDLWLLKVKGKFRESGCSLIFLLYLVQIE